MKLNDKKEVATRPTGGAVANLNIEIGRASCRERV